MIDTIKLAVPLSVSLRNAKIKWQTTSQIKYGYKACFYPTTQDKAAGRYVPTITYLERPIPGTGMRYELLIEASLPKLIYGDNLHEVVQADYDIILNRLKYRLLSVGIPVGQIKDLRHTIVRKVDFCKNIEFTNGVLALSVVDNIGSADVSRVYDVQKTDHRNGGKTYHIHTNCEDIAIYDKISDLQQAAKSLKRSEEKDNFSINASLEEVIKKRRVGPYEVVRFEVRLSSTNKLHQVLRKIGEKQDLTFENIYRSEVAKKVLQLHFNSILGRINISDLMVDTPSNLLADVLANGQAHGPQAVFAEVGFRLVAHDMANDVRKLRELVITKLGKDAWRRLEKYHKFLPRTQVEALKRIKEVIDNM